MRPCVVSVEAVSFCSYNVDELVCYTKRLISLFADLNASLSTIYGEAGVMRSAYHYERTGSDHSAKVAHVKEL